MNRKEKAPADLSGHRCSCGSGDLEALEYHWHGRFIAKRCRACKIVSNYDMDSPFNIASAQVNT